MKKEVIALLGIATIIGGFVYFNSGADADADTMSTFRKKTPFGAVGSVAWEAHEEWQAAQEIGRQARRAQKIASYAEGYSPFTGKTSHTYWGGSKTMIAGGRKSLGISAFR